VPADFIVPLEAVYVSRRRILYIASISFKELAIALPHLLYGLAVAGSLVRCSTNRNNEGVVYMALAVGRRARILMPSR
jgi:hypothetical protein